LVYCNPFEFLPFTGFQASLKRLHLPDVEQDTSIRIMMQYLLIGIDLQGDDIKLFP